MRTFRGVKHAEFGQFDPQVLDRRVSTSVDLNHRLRLLRDCKRDGFSILQMSAIVLRKVLPQVLLADDSSSSEPSAS